MRGKALHIGFFLRSFGITPAHAGKSTQGGHIVTCWQDHPRPCGEKK